MGSKVLSGPVCGEQGREAGQAFPGTEQESRDRDQKCLQSKGIKTSLTAEQETQERAVVLSVGREKVMAGS